MNARNASTAWPPDVIAGFGFASHGGSEGSMESVRMGVCCLDSFGGCGGKSFVAFVVSKWKEADNATK